MTTKKLMATLAAVLSLSLCGGLFAGCGSRETTAPTSGTDTEIQKEETGGVISIKVNPEIAVHYDDQGMVTKIEARNDDGEKVIADYTGFEGKECRIVIGDLVAAINEAGYFVEEADGKTNQITLEIEEGSVLPEENFLNMIVAEIQKYTSAEKISTPVAVDGEKAYGWSSYGDTDYGPDSDGITDYGDTDYGTTGDGATDYDDQKTTKSSGSTNQNTNKTNNKNNSGSGNTDYGNTDYGNTDYGSGSDGVTDYDDDDDGDSGYTGGQTTTTKPSASRPAAPEPSPAPSRPAQSGNTDYDDGNTDYDDDDDGDTDYDGDDDDDDDDDGDTDYDD